jgi:hypothetical protein
MGVMWRWIISILTALAAFGFCWWGLLANTKLDSGVAVGVAAVPFTIVLSLGGFWVDRARTRESTVPESARSNAVQIANSSVSGTVTGTHFGSNGDFRNAHILVGNNDQEGGIFNPQTLPDNKLRQKIFGEIPQQSVSFEERPELEGKLTQVSSNQNLAFAVTGIRGAGKSQLAAGIARRRLKEGWRLVGWINAEDPVQLLGELGQLAVELGLSHGKLEARISALRLRHWLEADGIQCLLVLDNAIDADIVRPMLPVSGRAQIIVTSSRQALASLGIPVDVSVFTPAQAISYLTKRTGKNDETGARAVATDLGYLPLALSQAAAVIVGQNLGYATYQARLANVRIADYLTHTQGDQYPLGVAEAIMLSVTAIEAYDLTGLSRQVLELISILSPSGTSRQLLYAAAQSESYEITERFKPIVEPFGYIGEKPLAGTEMEIDEVVHKLADSSLVTWGIDGTNISLHRLVARVVRERADHDGNLPTAVRRAIDILAFSIDEIKEKEYGQLPGVSARELTSHISSVEEQSARFAHVIDKARAAILIILVVYSHGYKTGHSQGQRHGRANKLAEEGRFDEAINELKKLLADMKGPQGAPSDEYIKSVQEDLRRIARQKRQATRNRKSS